MTKNDLYVSPNGEIIIIQKISKKNGITIEYQNGETFQISPLNFKSNFIKVRNNQLSALPQMETTTQIQISNLERELHDQLMSKNTNLIKVNKLREKIAKLKDNQTKQSTLFTFNTTYGC